MPQARQLRGRELRASRGAAVAVPAGSLRKTMRVAPGSILGVVVDDIDGGQLQADHPQ